MFANCTLYLCHFSKFLCNIYLFFSKAFKFLKNLKNFRFFSHKKYPCYSSEIINKNNEVPAFTMRKCRHRSTNICVNQFKCLLCLHCNSLWKWLSVVFSKDTTFTNSFFVFNETWQSSNYVILRKKLQSMKVQMPKSSMP